jgi:hypothetical protein
LQFKHYFRQAFVSYLILELFFVCLRDLVILAIDTAQIAVAKEDIAGAARADQRGSSPK